MNAPLTPELVMEALRDAGIYDDTAVFFFSDHGDFTGDYGLVEKTQNTFEDVLTRVPFIVKPPKGIPVQPRVSDALVELPKDDPRVLTEAQASYFRALKLRPEYPAALDGLARIYEARADEYEAIVGRVFVTCDGDMVG